MHELIAGLRDRPEVRVEEYPHSWRLHVVWLPHVNVELVVPHDVLEWYVTVRDAATGSELWSDWMDYEGYVPKAQESRPQLQQHMRTDIEWFLATLERATDFRVQTERVLGILPSRRAECCIDGNWFATQLTPRVTGA